MANLTIQEAIIESAGATAQSLVSYTNNKVATEASRATAAESILTTRMDTFTSLSEGSTTGDAELADIRIPADGFTVPNGSNAGTAVRTQVGTLNNKISEIVKHLDDLNETDNCKIQWYRGGYNTSTGKWAGNSLYSEDSNTTMMHPAPMQMLEGDVVPCPDGYTVSIAIYKNWHNTDDFEYTTSVGRRSTPYTITASRSGYWFMPVYKTANSDVICDGNYSFKSAAFELMRTITPMLSSASSYYSMAKRVNSLENKMETMAKALQSLTGGVLEKLDAVSAVQYSKKNIAPDNATCFGIWLIRDTNIDNMSGIPDGSGHAMLINIEQKSFYAASQFYIMVSGEHAGMIYMRTKNKKSWSGVTWTVIGGAS